MMEQQNTLNNINNNLYSILNLIKDILNNVNNNYRNYEQIKKIKECNKQLRDHFYNNNNFKTFELHEIIDLQKEIRGNNNAISYCGLFNKYYLTYIDLINKTFIYNEVYDGANIEQLSSEQLKYKKINEKEYKVYNRQNIKDVSKNRLEFDARIFKYSNIEHNIRDFIKIINNEIKNLREGKGGNLKSIYEHIYGCFELLIILINDEIRFYEDKNRTTSETFIAWTGGFFSWLIRGGLGYRTTARELTRIVETYIEPIKPISYINTFEQIVFKKIKLDETIKSFKEIEVKKENISECRKIIKTIDEDLHNLYKLLLIDTNSSI